METTITLMTFAIFLAIFLGVGGIAARYTSDSDSDYLLGNRSFGRFFVGLSAGATGNSGFIMIGAVGMAYTMGFSALILTSTAFIGEYLFWTFFAERVSRISIERKAQTVPELLGSSASSAKGKWVISASVAVISLILVGAYSAAQFSAAAKTMDVFFGVDPTIGALIAAVAILSYCVKGGLRASIWTDIVQAFVVLAVTIGMLIVGIVAGGGVSTIVSKLNAIDPTLTTWNGTMSGWPLVAYMFGFMVLGVGFQLSQPQVLVRLLAGQNPKEVKTARWVYLGYVYTTWTAMVLFGVICRVLLPDLADPEQALPIYAFNNFSPWLVGIVLAGVFSVIASTADSQILVVSSAVARDISPSFYKRMSEKYGIRYQQVMTLIVGVLAVIASIGLSTTVFSLVLFAVGALAGSIGPAMLITLTGRRTNYIALCASMSVGLVSSVIWRLVGYGDVLNEVVPGLLLGLIAHEIALLCVSRTSKTDLGGAKIVGAS